MSAVAGPSKKSQKVKAAPPPVSASTVESDSESDSESDASSADSDDIDSAPIRTPARAAASSSNGGRKTPLPAYEPPAGMEPVQVSVSFKSSPFEYDALANKKGVELWAIRVPADFKAARLSALSLAAPSKKGVRGSLATKNTRYTLSAVDAGADAGAGAEMSGLNLFVPSLKQGGALVRAPTTVARHLLLTPADGEEGPQAFVAPPKVKRAQPKNLKFRNLTTGYATAGPAATVVASHEGSEDEAAEEEESKGDEVAVPVAEETPVKKSKKSKEDKDAKLKKRKSEAEASPAKKKKKTKE